MAPTTAPISPAPSSALYQPKAWPRYVARNAPTMPRIVVSTKPEGSLFPGWMNFAITPATKPMMIVQIMPMPFLRRHPARNVTAGLQFRYGRKFLLLPVVHGRALVLGLDPRM